MHLCDHKNTKDFINNMNENNIKQCDDPRHWQKWKHVAKEARCQKQKCDLKEKELDLLSKLLNRLSEQIDTKAGETSSKLGAKPASHVETNKSRSKGEANLYTHFIVNYFFKKIINHSLNLLEGNLLFSLVPTIEFIISLNDIDIKESLLDKKIQELFYQAKNQSEEMIVKSINENNENDYTSYHLYNLMISNQMSIVNQLEEIITFYQHLDKEEQSKTPLIGMIKLSNLDNN